MSQLDRHEGGFPVRHVGPDGEQRDAMLQALGYESLDELVHTAVPATILNTDPIPIEARDSEHAALEELSAIMSDNRVLTSCIGMGYSNCHTPPVIQRNILENPGWYTQYTPYQAEIAQGRLEALLNYQTMVSDLTGLDIANASLLDEATAAAEAMFMCWNLKKRSQGDTFVVATDCHPQVLDVVRTRAWPLDIQIEEQEPDSIQLPDAAFGLLLQYPGTDGVVRDYSEVIRQAKERGIKVVMACDLLSLVLLKSPGEMGADIAVGNSQRFGVPMGYGGPHAGFFATREAHKRKMPGRIVGVSVDVTGKPGYRLAMATREQHIRREKATSNICTAQVLLAIMAGMYAVYHGPKGLRRIAQAVHAAATDLNAGLKAAGVAVSEAPFFDTVRVDEVDADEVMERAREAGFNLRKLNDHSVSIALDETTGAEQVRSLIAAIAGDAGDDVADGQVIPESLLRTDEVLTHPVFSAHQSETGMQRYMRKLEARDLSLTRSMIPLGSCTMKLNAAAELFPVTWSTVNGLHPFAPEDQAVGYRRLFDDLESWLATVTGFHAVSLQPNSGAQGEYAGLLVIKRYHELNGGANRDVCLIPASAHGTNPASAALAGMKIVVVTCDDEGNIDVEDLRAKAEANSETLAALMVTYPSTHGVFEASITEICDIVHGHGGQVYMDGANLQAQIGVCKAGEFGPDVCHLNLHKTFSIPHGGGGPGMGPIAVREHLAPYLPGHPVIKTGGTEPIGAVSAAPWGSPSILPISWMYIRMMGGDGLSEATRIAILNANYIAARLDEHYPVVYRGNKGLVAHECIIDLHEVHAATGVDENDVAKRLMDYGFHAPTVSWPVPRSMMIEPTESEPMEELDRFCDAMIAIREEIREIERGEMPAEDNVLKNAPHTAEMLTADEWSRPYSREKAAYPLEWIRDNKFWPFVGRIDNVHGDRNLICTCPAIETWE